VVGAGFIGAEVAASARQYGLDVTIVEYLPTAFEGALGPVLGRLCHDIHADHGVTVRSGVGVVGVRGDTRVQEVLLGDGTSLPADVVVVGVGVLPADDWLASSGLDLNDGVVCDATGSAEPSGSVFAAGDVARWYNPRTGRHTRAEHWNNACEQAHVVARTITGKNPLGAAPALVPYFWSDQYDTKIQMVGQFGPGARMDVVHGSLSERRLVATFTENDQLVAAVAFNSARQLIPYRQMLARQAEGAHHSTDAVGIQSVH
jgi:NADPH-dependent 2,4-dienoyl-CoA reductase/sulfur reductase-like enzyme